MQYVTKSAIAEPITDLGEFRAVVATWDRDREGDVIKPGAFAKTIREWASVGRRVPLHWNHKSELIIGHVEPSTMAETAEGLEVSGRIDLDTDRGREVWRNLKANRVGFSFGYVATKERERSDGGRDLLEIDVYEVSVTPSPMNNRTRVLEAKSMDDPIRVARFDA
jgi:uncharacterized protein